MINDLFNTSSSTSNSTRNQNKTKILLRNFLQHFVLRIEFREPEFNFLSCTGPFCNLLVGSGWPAEFSKPAVHSTAHRAKSILILSAFIQGLEGSHSVVVSRWNVLCGRRSSGALSGEQSLHTKPFSRCSRHTIRSYTCVC